MAHAAHGAQVDASNERALKITATLTGVYFVIELIAGVLIGSVAVISDAFHTFSAVGGVLIALVAARYARRPATATRTFGYLRAEIFGAFVNGFFLLGMALIVLWMGWMRLNDPQDLEPGPMLLVAAGGLLTEVVSLYLLFGAQKSNLNMRGAYWHVVQTFIGSLIIVVAASVIGLTGFREIDPLLGMAFGVMLVWASYGILKESLDIFLEVAPSDIDLTTVQADLEALPGVQDAHHMHAWSISSGRTIFSTHLRVTEDAPATLLADATDLLHDRHEVYFSTLQTELECLEGEPDALEFRGNERTASPTREAGRARDSGHGSH
jgi:cobalt-zinc-cadmium efflux system protein